MPCYKERCMRDMGASYSKLTYWLPLLEDKNPPVIESKNMKTKKLGIADVKVINDRVVIVCFTDGTRSKAVCNKDDVFSLEVGISICITKRIMSADEQTGHKRYNNAIKQALKVIERNEKLAKAEKEFEEKKWEIEENARKKREKRAQKRRQKRIEERAAAILLAEKMKKEAEEKMKKEVEEGANTKTEN